MKKRYILLISILSFLFLGSLVFISLDIRNSQELELTEAENNSGMGGGDISLPSFKPDIEIAQVEIPKLYYTVYSVKKGDMVGEIAARYDLSQDSIISVNRLRNTRTLQIGQLLKIPSMDGIVYTVKKGDTPGKIADSYKISLEKIALVNNITDNRTLQAGSTLFLPDAKLDWVTLQEINGDLFKSPIRRRFRITSRYGWRRDPFTRRRSFHNGIDLAVYRGCPIYAALAGKVVATGYSKVYGNYVIIRHHSGYQTMYGHMKSIWARRGQYVTTETKIGSVGSTGRSTGPHVHFTVYKNGSTINPYVVWH